MVRPRASPHPRNAWAEMLLIAAILFLTGWFYLWTVRPEPAGAVFSRQGGDYYNLLTRGFLKGRLSLDIPADPFLATLKNPWDPAENAGHGLHDASYYRGRYFIYFGVTPVLVLFLPVRLITGLDIDQSMASVVFAWVGLAASAWILAAVRRRYFPAAPAWAAALGAAAIGMADAMPVLLRRASIWEVPITCGYACLMVALALLYWALHGRRNCLWLALSSGAFGLAVGARPTYLFGCAALLIPVFHWMRGYGAEPAPSRPSPWKALVAAALPLSMVGICLAGYNYARFGSISEFGQRYQMGGEKITGLTLFNWRFIPYAFRLYWLLPASWSPYFPFLSAATIPPGPAGHMGAEDPFGILTNMPFALFSLGAFGLAGRRFAMSNPGLASFCRAAIVAAAATAITDMCFGGITNRYLVDFAPGFVLLASIGLLAITASGRLRGALRPLVALVAAVLLVFSSAFNVFASFRHNELFRVEHPETYRRMAHAWDRIPYSIDRRFHPGGYGDVELKVVFPDDAPGMNEPLVVTGNSFLADYLIVHYEPNHSFTFGLDHPGHGLILGKPVTLEPGVPHVVVVGMGSLYPPPGHPFFDSLRTSETRLIQGRVRVTVDGSVVLDSRARFSDATSWEPSIGNSGTGTAYLRPFSGRILSWRRVPPPIDNGRQGFGPVRLSLRLPAFTRVRSEPLVCSGETGRGDLAYIQYLAPGKVAFGFDHWGKGGTVSPPVDVDPGAVQTVTVDYGALEEHDEVTAEDPAGSPGRLLIVLNGTTIVDRPQAYFRGDPGLIAIGDNIPGFTTAGARFSGSMIDVVFLGH